MKLTIKITKEVLKRSMYCGTSTLWTCKRSIHTVAENCAIAVAIRDIFPKAEVRNRHIEISSVDEDDIALPLEATRFIEHFDHLNHCPEDRLKLPEFEFTVEVPDSIIDSIGIKEIHEIIERSETLELVEV